ncbi:hypothetical protein MSPP1_002399 [Malassezia sp. CBS 17886]|nr:hypothetical protein MSPP1_002399 [Malassezia sp. CBS 17886]
MRDVLLCDARSREDNGRGTCGGVADATGRDPADAERMDADADATRTAHVPTKAARVTRDPARGSAPQGPAETIRASERCGGGAALAAERGRVARCAQQEEAEWEEHGGTLRDAHGTRWSGAQPLTEVDAALQFLSVHPWPSDVLCQDPYAPDLPADLTNARAQPSYRGCLHPGTMFSGTQRNGRNSYNVTVEITNVNMRASKLGGYLKICGLTKEYPELTTYFDAEVVGSQYGFVTGKWGASEADDLEHWSRFPEFQALRRAPSYPHFEHGNQPFVFMRWKEQFLVPDHRVRSINGASFAGFYYVYVQLGDGRADAEQVPAVPSPGPAPARHTRTLSEEATRDAGSGEGACDAPPRTKLDDCVDGAQTRASLGPTQEPPASACGHMRGFYFHENSEPYQELSLAYIPERTSGAFEFR